jgi:exosome complex RNA-binding protein Csl4
MSVRRAQIKIATPGEPIFSTEEMVGDEGLYDDEGILRALTTGSVIVHPEEHLAEIQAFVRNSVYIRGGEKIICRIDEISGDISSVVPICRDLSGDDFIRPLSCTLSIRRALTGSRKELIDIYQEGDLIIADVLIGHPSVIISTVGSDCGLVMAWCKSCGRTLRVSGEDQLVCQGCKTIRRSIISNRYGRFAD